MQPFARTAAIATVLILTAALAWAVGSSSTSRRPPSDYSRASVAIDSRNYPLAIALLEKVVARDGRNADAYNLLGFSHRKLGDFRKAMAFYAEALRIDPSHKGAHEYIGEAYLETGNLSKAKEHLAKLDKICFLPCGEFRDLKKAVAAYEAKLR